LPTSAWVEVVTTAHELGIRSSSTMMYGHVDQPRHWLGHLRLLADIQDRTGGFTEFVTLPFIHTNAPVYLAGISRPGPTIRDNRAVTVMARLLLHGRIPNIQTSWVNLGTGGAAEMLRSGANDLGGTLMQETISHGRLRLRQLQVHLQPRGHRRRSRTPDRPAHHPVRRSVGGPTRGGTRLGWPPAGAPPGH
jgi:FO synthase